MWDLVGNPEDRFSHNEAQILVLIVPVSGHCMFFVVLVVVVFCFCWCCCLWGFSVVVVFVFFLFVFFYIFVLGVVLFAYSADMFLKTPLL